MSENARAMGRLPGTARAAAILGAITGAWMIIDAVHQLAFGDYFRIHGQLGPWAGVASAAGFDPMRLAIPFGVLGLLWLASCTGLVLRYPWAWHVVMGVAILSLPYCCVGTIFASLVLILLGLKSTRSGLKNVR